MGSGLEVGVQGSAITAAGVMETGGKFRRSTSATRSLTTSAAGRLRSVFSRREGFGHEYLFCGVAAFKGSVLRGVEGYRNPGGFRGSKPLRVSGFENPGIQDFGQRHRWQTVQKTSLSLF